ncbi:MAG TPA: hypothetical protein VHB20_16905 [Verrucomicrobiae bacterium]|jgi:hypothetical protein|nr:hypothetical protein [Verrucomicrobiae bacterium]
MRFLLALLMFLAVAAGAQDTNQFHAYAGYVNLIEGGRVSTVVIDWGDQRFTMRCPIGFASHVDNYARTVKFDAKAGAVAINITITTNSPGDLPSAEDLKAYAVASHPGSWVLQSYPFPTSYKPGLYVDLAQAPAARVSLRTRHGFLPTPKGIIEFVFSANDADFDKLRVGFMQSIGTFTVEPLKPRGAAH